MDQVRFPDYKKALGFSAQYVRASEDPGGSDAGKCQGSGSHSGSLDDADMSHLLVNP